MKKSVIYRSLLILALFFSNLAFAIDPPKITASGNQVYCPGTALKIIQTISITHDVAEPDAEAMYVQIAAGYNRNLDLLRLENPASHPKIVSSWDAAAGKLKLYSPTSVRILYTDFVAALKDISYSNADASPSGNRTFSITLGQANYLPSTGHYYQYVSNTGITWSAAKAQAESLRYYGLKGYLATLLSLEEAKLCGEQANGAGWVGGTDENTEGVWKWVTGPEGLANSGNGIVFWNGLANGSSPNFAYWNINEPNQLGNEDYAHITAPGVGIAGSWNDLSNTGEASGNYQPKGFIVEYGGMPGDPILELSASTSITIAQLNFTPPNSICAGQSMSIAVSSTSSNVNWFDAANGGNLLYSGTSYTTPALNNTTTYYVDYGCSSRKAITVPVEPLPVAHPVSIARQCDDNQDGIYTFDTSALESTLLQGQLNCKVTYFDANNTPLKDENGIAIVSPFPSRFTTKSQTIRAIVTNNSSLQCASQTNIIFTVDNLPQAFEVPKTLTTACDDEPISSTQDGNYAFDTSNIQAILLGGQTGMTVSYTDALGNQLPSPLPNPFLTSTQKITVRIENITNPSCIATTTLDFVIHPRPVVNEVSIIQCDTDLVVDGKTFFNLTVNNATISSNYTNETFTYYTTLNGANTAIATDLITNPLMFENSIPTLMPVWARITNPLTTCASVAKITLKVPATNIPPTYKIPFAPVCDDFLDSNGNNTPNNNKRDGISTFDLSPTKATILALLPTNQTYSINYYRNEADALAELNAISNLSNYRNIGYPNTQDIWIRIDSDLDNACYGLGPYLTLTVESPPIAHAVQIPRQCDDTSDGIFPFDTAALETTLLQGQTNVSIRYFDQANQPLIDANGNTITSPFPALFASTSQTIKAVVTNTTAQQCSDETLITFTVDEAPRAFTVASSLTTACDDEIEPTQQDGAFAFDTSAFDSIIRGGQTGMVIQYYDQNNTLLPSPLPNPFITSSQTVTAIVSNPINNICTASTALRFTVHPVPNISLNLDGSENELVCSNLATFFVTLDAGILDATPTTDYEYSWKKDGTTIGTNAPTLNVNTEGVYTVEVTNAAGCSRTRTLTVTASNIATIEAIDIVELSDVNTVTVQVSGPGDYQYSLDEPSGFWQDSNAFYNVSSGIHTVYVNDKNGCGSVSKAIAVVGIPKFFTPNGDGFNDVWNIKGISKYPNTTVQIFDRFGKLITILNATNTSWNGTFNGMPLAANDYWYVINFSNGTPEIKGHFSLKR